MYWETGVNDPGYTGIQSALTSQEPAGNCGLFAFPSHYTGESKGVTRVKDTPILPLSSLLSSSFPDHTGHFPR